MDFHIEKSTFLQALYYAQSIADRKSTMPILANVLLKSDGFSRVTVAATDLNLTVTSELPCSVQTEGGLTASAKHLYDIVKTLPQDRVNIRRAENNYVELISGKASYKVVGLADRDFPKLPSHKEVTFYQVDGAALRDLISKTFFSISTDETRSHLNGVLVEFEGQAEQAFVRMVSTDGHRLSKCERPLPGAPGLKSGIVVPRRGIMEIRRALEASSGLVEIGAPNQYFFLKTGTTVMSVRLTDANFPPYSQVIPMEQKRFVAIPTSKLLESLKRISLVASEKTWGVRLNLTEGLLRIESDNPDLGQGHEEIDVDYKGADFTIGFNAKYMVEFLSEVDSERVQLELNGDLDPGVIRPIDSKQGVGNQYLGVVMPMRL